ncbi:zinc finger protein 395 [Columba livia]|uniref:Zinc finger protein 395 n=1 Tax=Columba livia TaxID=8932 RepID=A0A2I0LVV2_COLLI|nr:zinc finger protein 395 [Columba livia]
MASVLSRRLGKRSLLGTRVSAPTALAEGVLVATQIPGLPTGDLGRVSAPRDDGSCALPVEESGSALRFPSPGCQQLHAGQQVLVTYNGQECPGLVEQHNLLSDKVKVPLPDQGLQPCWRVQDVQPPALPTAGSPGPSEALQRSVSSNIDVPKRKADAAVDMDEMVGAGEPLLQPRGAEPSHRREQHPPHTGAVRSLEGERRRLGQRQQHHQRALERGQRHLHPFAAPPRRKPQILQRGPELPPGRRWLRD